ncbi:MAG: hypothetical protein Q8M40_05635 [Legionella sp.]|nr:hypothetical protein [Legionella sp.]
MPKNSDIESGKNSKKPAFIGQSTSPNQKVAKDLDKGQHIYYGYAILDSLSSAYSMFKYYFDLVIGGKSDAMHEFMLTPFGIIGIALESTFLVCYSFLATRFDKEQNNQFKMNIAASWPYVREVIKGLKNGYKGLRSAVLALELLKPANLKYLIVPIGLIMGIVASVVRLGMRYVIETRKSKMTQRKNFLTEISNLQPWDTEKLTTLKAKILHESQSMKERVLMFFGVSLGSFVDGLYLYVGVLTLAPLMPAMLVAMSVLCAFYTFSCIVSRLYEEYDFQQRLLITQTECTILLVSKQMEFTYAALLELQRFNPTDEIGIQKLKNELEKLIGIFETERKLLKIQLFRSYFSAFFSGIKYGLHAYGALASVIFLVGSVLLLTGIAFPPALLVTSVSLGIVLMAGFLVHSLINHYQQIRNNPHCKEDNQSLDEMKKALETPTASQAKFHQAIKQRLSIQRPPQYLFQEWFEVFRSLFSGFGKGQRFVDFAWNSLQERDEQGHFQDTPVMYVLGLLSALLFGIILALRALAKGLGRPGWAPADLPELISTPTPAPVVEEEPPQQQTPPGSSPNIERQGESGPLRQWPQSQSCPPRNPASQSYSSLLTFFSAAKLPSNVSCNQESHKSHAKEEHSDLFDLSTGLNISREI